MSIDYASRRHALAGKTPADAFAFVPGANLRYFAGLDFHLSERPTIALYRPDKDDLAIIIPELEVAALDHQSEDQWTRFLWNDKDGYRGAIEQAVSALGLADSTIGLDDLTMRVFEWLALQSAGKAIRPMGAGQGMLSVRARKTDAEVVAIRRAIEITEGALRDLLDQVAPGQTEGEMVEVLESSLKRRGAEGLAFDTIVLSGPNSALPHGHPGPRRLGADELLLVDFGGCFAGYPADITRTVCLGTPSPELSRIHDLVREANAAAREIAAPGIACGAVDDAARAVIREAGYGDDFNHRTGHGLGLEIHELPQLAEGVEDVLEPGMVFTIEPGIYLAGVGGVRIEDDLLVTEGGTETLTSFPRGISI